MADKFKLIAGCGVFLRCSTSGVLISGFADMICIFLDVKSRYLPGYQEANSILHARKKEYQVLNM
jgi:hypothetical protein